MLSDHFDLCFVLIRELGHHFDECFVSINVVCLSLNGS